MSNTLDDKAYKGLLEAIRFMYGYDFTEYAEPSARRRILHFMEIKRIDTATELGRVLMNDEHVFEEFVQTMSVTVTEMFRDPLFYKALRDAVVSQLATYPVIKIWIAGCATGQEVYSIAILLKEEGLLDRSILYATDINQHSLQLARQGIFALPAMKTYTQNYLQAGGKGAFSEYYTAKHDGALFDRSLCENVVFSPHNLATDGSFNEFQLIICRNVIMYFNQSLQNKVVDLFHQSLSAFGFLGLGDKESLMFSQHSRSFAEISLKQKIYRKVK
ncbi:CheR family methyltransferase [Chryseolinea lacunae]|uniref:Protein-glutamate O-methyltransferase CheR n=1 Tax=Chryseolinea lacunae TaxID=2801331 RepID=A0ABS1KNF5_9BACT|nr:protein-glutamate O-methyltransferase CheR [Chryseolinea lacunae]MBL0740777.1 protein-glutamate O-methyltransferase CheR [Chryseolinea lacunae]